MARFSLVIGIILGKGTDTRPGMRKVGSEAGMSVLRWIR